MTFGRSAQMALIASGAAVDVSFGPFFIDLDIVLHTSYRAGAGA